MMVQPIYASDSDYFPPPASEKDTRQIRGPPEGDNRSSLANRERGRDSEEQPRRNYATKSKNRPPMASAADSYVFDIISFLNIQTEYVEP